MEELCMLGNIIKVVQINNSADYHDLTNYTESSIYVAPICVVSVLRRWALTTSLRYTSSQNSDLCHFWLRSSISVMASIINIHHFDLRYTSFSMCTQFWLEPISTYIKDSLYFVSLLKDIVKVQNFLTYSFL